MRNWEGFILGFCYIVLGWFYYISFTLHCGGLLAVSNGDFSMISVL